jgi:protein-tyrosine phosphatase
VLDFHNHLIPQVDDGSQSIEESRAAIAAMTRQGITNIITTPHLRASMLRGGYAHDPYFARVDQQWELLSRDATAHFAKLRLERGFEILLDVPNPDLSDPRTRLASSRFVLVEFPFTSIPPNSGRALLDIRRQGYEPIVAHPERYDEAQSDPERIEEWLGAHVGLQINAGSLIGTYGAAAMKLGWDLLARGWASYISSDYHATGECPSESAADAIRERAGDEWVEQLFTVNPEKLLTDELPVPVPPMPMKSSGWEDWLRAALHTVTGRGSKPH